MIQHKSNTITASTKIMWLYKENCAITQQAKEKKIWKKM